MLQTSPKRIHKSRILGLVFLVLVWGMFALWQRSEHLHQCELINESLSSQADALSSAVSSGLQSHRWFGPFVQEQLPSTLAVLARSTNVLAIAVIVNDDPSDLYLAGDKARLDPSLAVGDHFRGDTFQVVRQFSVQNSPPMMMMHGGFSNESDSTDFDNFRSVVVLDRSGTIAQIRREARGRILIFSLGTLLLLAIGAVWQFTVRLAHSEGATRVLMAETRHLRELGQAAAGLAHETRNPLGLIRGWTQRLVETGLPSEGQQEQAEVVLEECDRVTARINQFLAFARPADIEMEAVVTDDLVQELRILLQLDLDARGLALDTESLDQPRCLLADRDQFRQAVFNLLQNAIAFAPEQSTIRISVLKSRRATYRLEVSDQGPGVSAEIADNLFEPYVTGRAGGTGLGLSIVRSIAVAHGWEVGYQVSDQGGSVFWIDGIHAA